LVLQLLPFSDSHLLRIQAELLSLCPDEALPSQLVVLFYLPRSSLFWLRVFPADSRPSRVRWKCLRSFVLVLQISFAPLPGAEVARAEDERSTAISRDARFWKPGQRLKESEKRVGSGAGASLQKGGLAINRFGGDEFLGCY
jgi:hypothetical protein